MTYAEGALVEPLSVAAGAVSRATPKLGQPVLVCGAGPIGLAAALCARAAGAHPVCITDLDENRLNQAREFGFELTVKVDLKWDRQQFADKIRETMGADCHPEIAFECTGAQSSIQGSIYVGLTLVLKSSPGNQADKQHLLFRRPSSTEERSSRLGAESPMLTFL